MSPAPLPSPRPIPLRITGTGQYLPARSVESFEFDAKWGKPAGWTQRHVGIISRRIASADEPASLMGALAGERALVAAGVTPGDIDWLVSACSVGEQALPCTAALIHRRMGLSASGIA
jgi:3-oxoacyl-[acyl-carrier-protein] synthase-3